MIGWSHWRNKNEIISLAAAAGVFGLVFFPISKGMMAGSMYSALNYYYIHRRAHLEPEWARTKIPWHYDHHMNSNQDANWCVTKPWFDYILGTRVISSPDLQEQNPLGIALPRPLSALLNRGAENSSRPNGSTGMKSHPQILSHYLKPVNERVVYLLSKFIVDWPKVSIFAEQ